jgi:hypothetical protein
MYGQAAGHQARQRPGPVSGIAGCARDGLPAHRAARYGRQVTGAIVIGVVARTGSAVAIALSGTAAAPRFRARREFELVPAGLISQPYHASAGPDLAAAGDLIARVESAAEHAAAAGLLDLAGMPPTGAVRAVAVVVKAASAPGDLAAILRSHAWMHAAEGMLYRQAVLAAATECGWTAHAVDQSALPAAEQAITAVGRAAGRPWRRLEKDATRAALTLLTTANDD